MKASKIGYQCDLLDLLDYLISLSIHKVKIMLEAISKRDQQAAPLTMTEKKELLAQGMLKTYLMTYKSAPALSSNTVHVQNINAQAVRELYKHFDIIAIQDTEQFNFVL
jgi:hypothetical protein